MLPRPFVELALAIADGVPLDFAEGERVAASPARRPWCEQFQRGTGPRPRPPPPRSPRRSGSSTCPARTDAFALGPEKYRRLLWVREGLTMPPRSSSAEDGRTSNGTSGGSPEIAAVDAAATSSLAPFSSRSRPSHPPADGLLPAAREDVALTRQLVVTADLATIPPNDHCRVEESPPAERALFTASMDIRRGRST